jgi:hypothetical protein
MRHPCRAVDASFLASAPWRFRSSAELSVSPSAAFAVLEEAASWPHWLKGIQRVEWTSPKPFGIGTTRTVTLSAATVDERFFRWDTDAGFSFCIDAHEAPIPLFAALAEDYTLEALDGGRRCRFTYTVGIEPALALRLTGPLGRWNLRRMFESAPRALARYVAAK